MKRGQSQVFLALLLFAAAVCAQTEETRTLELQGDKRVAYELRTFPADAHLLQPGVELAPTSALDSAKLLYLHLSIGDIEEAALLSNSPRRRFAVLQDYRESIGEEEFKRVFAQYFDPRNRIIAEVAIGNRRLLVWNLQEGATRIAGQYFVEIEGRYLIDDVPNETRNSLRAVLEAYRSGKLPR